MDLYKQRQRWKIGLVVLALLFAGTSLWITNMLVNKLAGEERKKIHLWGEAIQRKAKLVQYTNSLFTKVGAEEQKKVELWAMGTKELANPSMQAEDLSFIFEVIRNNQTVPVILTNDRGKVLSNRNLDSIKQNDTAYVNKELAVMKAQHDPIVVKLQGGKRNYLYYKDSRLFTELKNVLDTLVKSFITEVAVNSAAVPVLFMDSTKTKVIASGNIDTTSISTPKSLKEKLENMEKANLPLTVDFKEEGKHYIYYEDSFILTLLRYYPFVQFSLVGVFLILAYAAFSATRNSEQNQVWVGMAKETAHQLGTPLSSLMAWTEYLNAKGNVPEVVTELNKDLNRLETITQRFSKIGSAPKLELFDLRNVLIEATNYLQTRTSKNVQFIYEDRVHGDCLVLLNPALFGWVIENVWRNAVDAMDGKGKIILSLNKENELIHIDIEDTGKGIQKSSYKSIFKPGFTSKKRGWGLGLSLAKRIIENYHKGKIFVLQSELGKGTTFRIELNKA